MLLTTRDRLRKQMREVGWGGGVQVIWGTCTQSNGVVRTAAGSNGGLNGARVFICIRGNLKVKLQILVINSI